MGRAATITLFCSGLWAACLGPVRADDRRVALAVGVSSCAPQPPSPRPVGDAQAIAGMLREAGFDTVRTLVDPRREELSAALTAFAQTVAGADTAVVFYAGCGAEVGDTTYLIPADATVASAGDLAAAVPMDDVLRALAPAGRLGLVLYDASRSDPFASGTRRRAARDLPPRPGAVEPRAGDTLIAYATGPRGEARDGGGAHSPFTTALLANLAVPGLDVRLALVRVRDAVLRATDGAQEPYTYGSLGGGAVALAPAGRR